MTPHISPNDDTNAPPAPTTHAGPRTSVHKDWYTDPNVPLPWSTDWGNWEGLDLFRESVDGTLKIDKLFKETYDVPGVIEPLAYMLRTSYEIFVFAAAGRYYIFDDGCLHVSDEDFRSHQHFLEKALPKCTISLVEMQQREGSDLAWLAW